MRPNDVGRVMMGLIAVGCSVCHAMDNGSDLDWLDQYNVTWTSQSTNSGDSMPVSGGDIGLNVWVEGNELLVYMGRAGYRDENGALLRAGRVRVQLTPNPFIHGSFRQELKLRKGCVLVSGVLADGTPVATKVWTEVARPIVHLDIHSDKPITAAATYESWRTEDIELPNDGSKHDRRGMCMINYDAYPGKVFLRKDQIRAGNELVRFHHRVDNTRDAFNFQVKQQGLESVREQLVNPFKSLVWGGALVGDKFALAGETNYGFSVAHRLENHNSFSGTTGGCTQSFALVEKALIVLADDVERLGQGWRIAMP